MGKTQNEQEMIQQSGTHADQIPQGRDSGADHSGAAQAVRRVTAGDDTGRAPAFPSDVSVSVIAYNALRTLPVCMQGMADTGCPPHRITVYDVASTDGSGDWLAEHYPDTRVVRLDENLGPNPARNLAVTQADTPFVLVLDADVQLLPETVGTLRDSIGDDESVAIATPVVLYADRPDTVQYYDTWVHFLAEACADVEGKPLAQLAGHTRRVGLASGCSPLIRTYAALRVGLFEERYFFGKDDGEFSYRVTVGGYKIIEPDAARVLHHHHKRGSKYLMHQVCNRWHFMLKDYQWRTLVVLFPVLLIHEPAIFLLLLVKGKAGDYVKALVLLTGMVAGLAEGRKRVRAMRRRHDWQVLRGDRLVIPGDLTHSPIRPLVKGYTLLLGVYWELACRVLRCLSGPISDARDKTVV